MERIFLEIQSEGERSEAWFLGFARLIAFQEYETGSRKDFLQKLQDGEYNDVVGLYRSNNSTSVRRSEVAGRQC